MKKIIDEVLINDLNKAIDIYVNDDVEIDVYKISIIALLNSLVSKLEDINFLIKNHRYNSAKILARVTFETYVYLTYILEKNNRIEQRGKAYYYSNFQKLAYYLKFIDKTNLTTQKELVESLNASKALKNFNSVNDYLNKYRENFCNCFSFDDTYKKKKLHYKLVSDQDSFQSFKIDTWKWYNDDKNTRSFKDLVEKLNLQDEYLSIYAPTSNFIHSDGLQSDIKIKEYEPKICEINFTESYSPECLVFFNLAILKILEHLKKQIHDPNKKTEFIHRTKHASTLYRINNGIR